MRPDRFGPPRLAPSVVERPRLLALLARRFDRRLVTIEGAGGFGKTTLLAQAVEENRRAPVGVDVWLTCEPADGAADHLLSALARALGSDTTDADADDLAALVWARAPMPLAFLLDDAHTIPVGSPGAVALEALLAALPANGHLALAGRSPLPVRVARLLAQDQAIVVDEEGLRLTAAELAEVAREHGLAPHALDASGGWPALAALGAAAGPAAARRFVLEEVYAALPDGSREALAALCGLGGGDDALVGAALGREVDLDRELASVPLIARHDRGWYRPHALWAPIVEPELARDAASRVRRRGAAELLRRDDFAAGAELLLDGPLDDDDWATFRDFVTAGCQLGTWAARGEVVATWYARLPEDRRSEPEGQLLAAASVRLREGDSHVTTALFEQAMHTAAESGNVAVELAALSQLGHLAWWRDDLVGGLAICERAAALAAQGYTDAEPIAAFGQAMLAEISGDPTTMHRVIAAVDRSALSGLLAGAADWLQARALLQLGRADEAIPFAERACVRSAIAAAQTARVIAYHQAGRLDEALALAASLDPTGFPSARDRFLSSVVLAAGYSRFGRIEEARRAEAIARADAPTVVGLRAAGLLDLARARLALAEGCEEEAAEISRQVVGDEPDPAVLFAYLAFLPALYVLVPTTRPAWHALDLGPDHALTRAIASAFVAAREGYAPAAGSFPPTRVLGTLGVVWAIELAARADDDALAECCLRYAPSATRTRLHALVTGDTDTARGAAGLLRRVPTPPATAVVVRLFGPASIERDGIEVDHPDWRRERVRSLLAYLAVSRRATRGEIAGALWPDHDTESALGNLRVTLRYLQRVLEPDRDAGAAGWFVRSVGDVLSLTTDRLSVDVWELERRLDRARDAEAAGHVADALAELEAGLDFWRGDFLADVFDEWADFERDRVRVRVLGAAIRAGELLLARDADRALQLASRCLQVEPWSEPAYRLAASAHLAAGDRASARRTLDRCHAMLDELGVEAEPETVMLERRVNSAVVAG